MPAGCDVARPHVCDDRSARRFGDPCRLTELQAAARPALGIDPVEDRLTVRDDEVDGAPGEALDGRLGHLGERLADERVEPADLGGRRRRRRQHGTERRTQLRRVLVGRRPERT